MSVSRTTTFNSILLGFFVVSDIYHNRVCEMSTQWTQAWFWG